MGIRRTIHYRVRWRDLASRIYWSLGRSRRKPAVFATARLLWLCELAVMGAVPGVSLGVEVKHLKHIAPAPRGSMVTVDADCIGRDGHYWDWRIEVRDEHEVLARCELRFVADIDRARYQRRLAPKLAARPAGLVWWLHICDALTVIVVVASPVQLAYAWQHSMLVTETGLVAGWLVARLTGLPSAVSDWMTVRKGVPRRNLESVR